MGSESTKEVVVVDGSKIVDVVVDVVIDCVKVCGEILAEEGASILEKPGSWGLRLIDQ